MKKALAVVVAGFLGAAGQYVDHPLVTFDEAHGTTFQWEKKDDFMMGGSSNASFTISKGSALFEGSSGALPTPAGAPGFVSVQTLVSNFTQMNGCLGISITSRATTNYTGYRLSFGTDTYYSRQGYKAPFYPPVGKVFGIVNISFYDFTRAWNDATGLPESPELTCSKEIGVCPTFLELNNAQRMEVWAQGALGNFNLEIKAISAYGCAPSDPQSRRFLV